MTLKRNNIRRASQAQQFGKRVTIGSLTLPDEPRFEWPVDFPVAAQYVERAGGLRQLNQAGSSADRSGAASGCR